MIKEIRKLKNFGIYHDFNWGGLPKFKKYNLIYGWNRSGKTTISRIFSSCEKRSLINIDTYPENREFEVCLKNGTSIKSNEVKDCNLPVRVFNQDFIDDNISFEPDKYSNGIIYVSEEDIETKKKLSDLKKQRDILQKTYSDAKKNKSNKEKVKNTFLTSLGREISNVLFDKAYNKSKVQTKINEVGAQNFDTKIISEKEKSTLEEITKRKIGDEISAFKRIEIKLPIYNGLDEIVEHVKLLLTKKVVSETLDRLKNNEELNDWVKKGFDLQKSHNEYGQCLFCQNPISSNLFDSLSKHFSKDYIELQEMIEYYKESTKQVNFQEISSENSALYPELIEEYRVQAEALNSSIREHNKWFFMEVEALLDEKYKNPFDDELIEMFTAPNDFENNINKGIDGINDIIKKHNNKVKNHSSEVNQAKEKLELHTIAVAIKEQDFKSINTEFVNSETIEAKSLKELKEIEAELDKLEKITSQISGAIGKINKHLNDFFGKEEITLDLDKSKKGYVINRNGQLAHKLSEGEKTAIAFSYFIVKVEEKEFNIENGIIFIDDPISSFDSNFIYHSFSLISEHFNKAGQLFISTHNFQFFNLIKDWFSSKNYRILEENKKLTKENKPLKLIPAEFYMVENFTTETKRDARIIVLDNTLRKFKSEYHFLFNRLKAFLKSSPDYADLYSIGNIARRYFEIYADFKIPNSSNQKQKMEALVKIANSSETVVNTIECGKVYKLINEFSHNYNPTSSIEHTDRSECMEAVNILFKIVKYSDLKHFEILEKGYN